MKKIHLLVYKIKSMIQKTKGDDYIIWQPDPEDGVAEKAILVESYSDVITLQQNDQSININYESIDELCKLLKKLKMGMV
jgi:hypothetical protein